MSMNPGLLTVSANLLMTFENIILLVVILAGILFYVKDVKLGLIMHILGTAGLFIWFYSVSYNWVPSLVCMFVFLILLCLSLFPVLKTSPGGFV